jgi:hypothetical protein
MDRRTVATPVILLLLFLAALAPRLLVLDTYVTADERKWLNRSGNFYLALSQADWASTLQKAHPGVTVTWLGTLGFLQDFPDLVERVTEPITDDELEALLWEDGTVTPLGLLAAGRRWVIVAIALAIAAFYLPLRKLYGSLIAAAGALYVAWSPFFLGLSHQLHPDGLLAILSVLALALFMAWIYAEREWRYLISSSLVLGLALLTKTPAVAIILSAGLLVIVESVRPARERLVGISALWMGALIWGLGAGLLFVMLWPTMWVRPYETLQIIAGQMEGYRVEGHSLPSYFMGRIGPEQGPLFYPVALIFRLSAMTTIGLVLAVGTVWRRVWPYDSARARWALLGNLLFAVVLLLLMTIASKKLDRYILPATLALDLIALTGWLGAIHIVTRRIAGPEANGTARRRAAVVTGLAVLCVVFLQGIQAFSRYPYYALSFNPLIGGNRLAPQALMIGWGEGLNEVGAWLTGQQEEEPLHVVSWYEDGPLSYYLPDDSQVMSFIESDNYWFDADYVVLYANQWQRENPDPDMINHFLSQDPIFAVNRSGLELAKVYKNREAVPPPFTRIYVDSAADFENKLRLPAYRLETRSTAPGESVEVTLFLKAIASMDENYLARLRLLDPANEVIWQEERRPSGSATADWPPGKIRPDTYDVSIPPDALPGLYAVQYALFGPDTALPLAVQSAIAPSMDGYHAVTTINVQAPEPVPVDAVWAPVRVTEVAHVDRIRSGQILLVDLAADEQPEGPWALSLRLVDPQGKTQAQQDKALAPSLRYSLDVPVDVGAGTYTLSAVVYNAETLAAVPDQNGASPTILSSVDVVPR